MHLLNSTLRITIGERLVLVPALFRLAEGQDGALHLQDADVDIAGARLAWTAKVGLAFSSADRASLEGTPTMSLQICDERRRWRARCAIRSDGMETVMVTMRAGEIDLAETSFVEILDEGQRMAIEFTAEAIGREAPRII